MYLTLPSIAWPQLVFGYSACICACLSVTYPQPWFPIFSINSLNPRGALSLQTQTESANEDTEHLTGHRYVRMGQTGNTIFIYHQPRGAWGAWWSSWSLGTLSAIIALWKQRFSAQQQIMLDAKTKCVTCTHPFAFEPSGTFPSRFSGRTWCTLKKYTVTYKITTMTPKVRTCCRGVMHLHTGGF